MQIEQKLVKIFNDLLKSYGYQGWWPFILSPVTGQKSSKLIEGYHPGDYHFPQNSDQKLETCLGAILTQNTNWKNVVQALVSLKQHQLFSLKALQNAGADQIALAIKSAGYYNQKAQTIKRLVQFLSNHPFEALSGESTSTLRSSLLEIKGIGPETADCILLYALDRRSFVVDAYTRRILETIGIVDPGCNYQELKQLFESRLEKNLHLFQEYHALLVCHGKLHYSKKPFGVHDRILNPSIV